jgi:hypothetical protein
MLTFSIYGPDASGMYAIVYATPGSAHITMHTTGLRAPAAVEECERLNAEQQQRRATFIVSATTEANHGK